MWFSTPWSSKRQGWATGLCAACMCCVPAWASALPHADQRLAGHAVQANAGIQQQLPGSRLQGQATLRFFGLPVYHARLWVRPDFDADRYAEHAFILELKYLRTFKGSAIAQRSLQEMRRVGGFSTSQAEQWLAIMQAAFPDVQKGDRLAGLYEPGVGVRFWFNGQPAATVADAEFGRVFFGVWLASTTSEPDMRLTLLGQRTAP